LQNSKDLQGPVGGLRHADGRRWFRGRLCLLLWSKTKLLGDVGGQFAGE